METENLRICKRCLTRDMIGQEEYFRNLHTYIENLDDEIKICQPQYEQRLAVCQQCDLLINGMCKACGCFVELRAAVRKNACPYSKWLAHKTDG